MNVTVYRFENVPIRTTVERGIPLWCAKDVAGILGYANVSDAIKTHCKGKIWYQKIQTAGGIQTLRYLEECDVLRLIVGSKMPEAERFEKWVFEEVLPAIRKYGGYLTQDMLKESLLSTDTLYNLVVNLKKEEASRIKAEEEAAKAASDAEEKTRLLLQQETASKPYIDFYKRVADADECIYISDMATLLAQNGVEIGTNRLYSCLRHRGWLISRSGPLYNTPTQKAMDTKRFRMIERTYRRPDGSIGISMSTVVTPKGQKDLLDFFMSPNTEDEAAAYTGVVNPRMRTNMPEATLI